MSNLLEVLESQLVPERLERIRQVVQQRTYAVRVVLEDIFQGHNAAAVLRSCECFGVQHIHCVELRNEFRPNDEVAMGSQKWLSLHRHTNTAECLHSLQDQGYRTVALTLREGAVPLDEVPVDRPIALTFGTELNGLTQEAHDACDTFAYLPMVGFTQSFNISVSAALSLQTLTRRLKQTDFFALTPQQQDELYLDYLKRSVPNHEKIIRHLANQHPQP